MSIRVGCIQCGKMYQLDDRFAGKKAKCHTCGNVIDVPAVPAGRQAARPFDKPAAKPVQRAPIQAAEPAGTDVDLSALDDIERTGTIDDTPREQMKFAPPREAPVVVGSKGTRAPAYLRPGGGGKRSGNTMHAESQAAQQQPMTLAQSLIPGAFRAPTRPLQPQIHLRQAA